MIDEAVLVERLRPWLPAQRWYSGTTEPASVSIVSQELLKDGSPAMAEVLVQADGGCYQVVLGLRGMDERPDFLRGREPSVLGEVWGDLGNRLAYDAALDPELDMAYLGVVTAGAEHAERVRPVSGEQSNTSLVFDDRVILKLFRRLHEGRNLDVEMTEALAEAGFTHVAPPLATLTRHGFDLAVLQPFLMGGADGWALALTSLRDLFGVGDTQPVPVIRDDMPMPIVDPAQAGGDFSAEAGRLGTITAEMHVALAAAFGRTAGDANAWADGIQREVSAMSHGDLDMPRLLRLTEALRRVGDPGPAIRLHGDLHLGQMLRTDSGWFVLDFEGEPARPPEERRRMSSPLRDVAGMLRSFHYASRVALFERDEDCAGLAMAWETRNRKAFLAAYDKTAGEAGLLPPSEAARDIVLSAFELEKAAYELRYELAHRPDWQTIPLAALARLGEEA